MGIETAREETLARLVASRAEIRRLLEPPPRVSPGDGPDSGAPGTGAFPRSRTMKLLMSTRGAGTLGAVVCGLIAGTAMTLFRGNENSVDPLLSYVSGVPGQQ